MTIITKKIKELPDLFKNDNPYFGSVPTIPLLNGIFDSRFKIPIDSDDTANPTAAKTYHLSGNNFLNEINTQFSSSFWKLGGNDLSSLGIFGSKNNFPLSFIVNNSEALRVTINRLIGIGTSTPQARQHTVGVGNTTATIAQRIDSSTTPNIWQVDDAGRVGQGSLLDTWHTHRASNGTYSSAIIPIGTDPSLNYANGSTWFVDSTNNILRFQKGTLSTDYLFTEDNHRLKNTEVVPRMLEVDKFGNITASRFINDLGLVVLAGDIVSDDISVNLFNTSLARVIGNAMLNASTHPTNPQMVTGVVVSLKSWARFTYNNQITTLLFNVLFDTQTVATTDAVPIVLIDGDSYQIKIDLEITIREMGVNGKVYANGEVSIVNTNTKFEALRLDFNSPLLAEVTIDTTSQKSITAQIIQGGLTGFTQAEFTVSGGGITFLYK